MTRWRRMQGSDSGVALVMALVFLLVVGAFVTVALEKSSTTTLSGVALRDRGSLQYSLDAGVDRGLQVLRMDLATGTPTACKSSPESEFELTPTADAGGLALNGQKVGYTCQTLAGRAAVTGEASNTNYAMVVTDAAAGALTTSGAVSADLKMAGSIYLNGQVDNGNVGKTISLQNGDLVSPVARAGCDTDLAALTNVDLAGSGQLRACTEQTVSQTYAAGSLPSAPTFTPFATAPAGLFLTQGVPVIVTPTKTCRVFYPGRYLTPPDLVSGSSNYFVSGLYYFQYSGQWQIKGDAQVIGGQPAVGDPSVPTGDCDTMTDSVAMNQPAATATATLINPNRFTTGVTWAFGKPVAGSGPTLDFSKGAMTLFSPPAAAGSVPVSIVGVSSTTGGYLPLTTGADLITGGNNNSSMQVNGKILAPTSGVSVFSTNNSLAAVAGGIVAYHVDLKASRPGSSSLLITAPGSTINPPPPFRTVRVRSRDLGGGSTAINTAVATISNFAPYTVKVLSWRTS